MGLLFVALLLQGLLAGSNPQPGLDAAVSGQCGGPSPNHDCARMGGDSDEFTALSMQKATRRNRSPLDLAPPSSARELPRCVCDEYRNGASASTVPICQKVEGGVRKCMPPNPGDGKCPGDHQTCTPTEVPPEELPPCTCDSYRNGADESQDPLCLKNEGGENKCMPPNPGDGKCPGDHAMCTTKRSEPSFVATHGRLRVEGNQVVDQHGEKLRLRGTSFFWSQWEVGSKYYTPETVQWLVKDWKVTVVRCAMGIEPDGYLLHPERERAKVETVVDAAIRAGIYVIIDWHDHHAEEHVNESKAFFADMSRKYGSFPHVLFEPFNEPESQPWATVIKPYHEQIVPILRENTENIIILGTRQWSQLVQEASLDPVPGKNLVYTVHFYANTHEGWLRDEVVAAQKNGAAVFCSEWGTCDASGNGDLNLPASQVWMDFFEERGISDANWATDDKDEACAQLEPGTPEAGWAFENLTLSGAWVRASLRGDPPPPTPAPTPAPTGPCMDCSVNGENCQQTKCCKDPSMTCYVKDEGWAGCKTSCTPGIDPNDPPEYQTNWTCEVLVCEGGPPPVECSSAGADCRTTPTCCDPAFTCYEKDEYYATCKESCTPGIDPNDPPEFQTNWTCEVVSAP